MDALLQLFWVETDLYLLQGSAQVLELFHRGRSYNVYVVLQLDQVGLGDQLIVTWMEFLQLFNHFCVLGCKDNKLPNVLISAGKMLFLITSLFLGCGGSQLQCTLVWLQALPKMWIDSFLATCRGCFSSFSLGWGVGKDIKCVEKLQ